jgi:hypothetical protein
MNWMSLPSPSIVLYATDTRIRADPGGVMLHLTDVDFAGRRSAYANAYYLRSFGSK